MTTERRNLFVPAVIALLGLALTVGCAKKNKPDQAANDLNNTAANANIQNKDMSFDAVGSDSGQIVGLYTVHFDFDKSALTSDAKQKIVKNFSWLKKHPNSNLEIQGHCDRSGSEEYNLALGERRAKAVEQYMINLGANAHHLSIISYGKERMLDTAETEEADAKNRRANFRPIETVKNSLSSR